MKVTSISVQSRDPNRVNVKIDGVFSFSLEISQVISLGVKKDTEYTPDQIEGFKLESQFGRLYSRTLEYVLMRPRSQKEVRDYLWRKSIDTRRPDGSVKQGVSKDVTERVFSRLVQRGYLDDDKFAQYWIDNRKVKKGVSLKALRQELSHKGVDREIIDKHISQSDREDIGELNKVILRKRARYSEETKLITYLMRQGFGYGDIKSALEEMNGETE